MSPDLAGGRRNVSSECVVSVRSKVPPPSAATLRVHLKHHRKHLSVLRIRESSPHFVAEVWHQRAILDHSHDEERGKRSC